jgi:NAD(P)-dependent dehydrogenase (short-subunit alcohol dehydrogenase family)
MRALVTGAANGIGRASCLALARAALARREPASIAAVDLRVDQLNEVAAELRALGATVLSLQADMGTPDGPGYAVTQAVEAFGGLDTVVSNAGTAWAGPLVALSLEDWERIFAVNTRASWLLAKAAHPSLRQSQGSLVVVASIAATHPQANLGAYSPSKAAVLMLVEVLAQEWGADRIRVNAVSPGWVHSAMTAKVYANPELAAQRAALVPLGRVALPDDIADVITFLASEQARYITGHNLVADAGLGGNHMGRMPGLSSVQRH